MVLQFPVKLGSQPVTPDQLGLLHELRRQLHAAGVAGQTDGLQEAVFRLGCTSERELMLALLRLVVDPPRPVQRPQVHY